MDNTAAFYDGLVNNATAQSQLAALKKKELNKIANHCACNTRLNKEKLVRAVLGRLRESRLLGEGPTLSLACTYEKYAVVSAAFSYSRRGNCGNPNLRNCYLAFVRRMPPVGWLYYTSISAPYRKAWGR